MDAISTVTHPSHTARHLLRHLFEMVVAMILGMAVFGAVVWGIFGLLGHADLRHYAGVRGLVMSLNMIIGMSLWMRIRRHSWSIIGEMSWAMFLPYVALIGPYLVGLLSGPAFLGAMHLLMLPMMIGAMLHRREEYLPVLKDEESPASHPSQTDGSRSIRGEVSALDVAARRASRMFGVLPRG